MSISLKSNNDGTAALQLNGADILTVDATGKIAAVNAPAQFDNSQKLITSAALSAFGIQASGTTIVTATAAVPLSAFGGTVLGGASSAITQTMPALASVPVGARVEFFNAGTGNMTVANNGGDGSAIAVNAGARVSSLVLGPGDSLVLEKVNAAYWAAKGGSIQIGSSGAFGNTHSTNGYQKLPSGLIMQWGVASITTVNGSTSTTFAYPIAFPSGVYSLVATLDASVSDPTRIGIQNNTASVFSLGYSNTAIASRSVSWAAIGK